jgi:hypothetical protein
MPNKGSGAGGMNTNVYGKLFEEKTNHASRLLEMGFYKCTKHSFDYLYNSFQDKKIYFITQTKFKKFMKYKYNKTLFRYPDEAYIIEYNSGKTIIKIIEKKEQRTEGSVETKLWSGPSLKREYELVVGEHICIDYSFCVNEFLQNKLQSDIPKYTILNTILQEANIRVFYGDEDNYFDTIQTWIFDE